MSCAQAMDKDIAGDRDQSSGKPLRVCLLSYRSNPHCGGQGVYIKNLSRALRDLGHSVDVLSGPPYMDFGSNIRVHEMGGLDLYDPNDPFRVPKIRELTDPINVVEWLGVSSMGFPEPMTFGMRAQRFIFRRKEMYDVIHDNQSLSWGVRNMGRWVPTVATIHHPITVDRDVAISTTRNILRKIQIMRWYSFIGMQKRVSRQISRVITVSDCSKGDISREFSIPIERIRVVANGIDTTLFHPIPGVRRDPDTIMVTNSADTPLKGLYYLLKAVSEIRRKRPLRLVVIGTPKKDGSVARLVVELGLTDIVHFTGRISDEDFVKQYAGVSLAVVPSLYEGFGFPAGEAMACAVPVISTTGGALPEVVGDAGVLVPPADPNALEAAILDLLDNPEKAAGYGQAGYERVHRLFTWKNAAQETVRVYREAIDAHHPV